MYVPKHRIQYEIHQKVFRHAPLPVIYQGSANTNISLTFPTVSLCSLWQLDCSFFSTQLLNSRRFLIYVAQMVRLDTTVLRSSGKAILLEAD